MDGNAAESLSGRTFRNRTLRGSRFVACDLGEVVVRGSDVAGMELDSPWLLEGGSTLLVNGVDVVPLVDAELDRRFPGRGLRTAGTPEGLAVAWHAVEQAWAATLGRAGAMPEGSVEASVDGEWSLAQTLRHLVMATDMWLGRAVLGLEHPFHPGGLPDDSSVEEVAGSTSTQDPTWAEVLEARVDRQRRVREHIASLSVDDLAAPRSNPHDPRHEETVLSCLRTILEEEWEHHRYAVRDLDVLAARATTPT